MHTRRMLALGLLLSISCGSDLALPPEVPQATVPQQTPEPEPAEEEEAIEPVVLVGAGDIADCKPSRRHLSEATAKLLDEVFADGVEGLIFTAGDNAYLDGTEEEFRDCYDRSWGRHKARTRPAIGNHEYRTPGAAGYHAYFGEIAGEPGRAWYSYELGGWKVVVLDSNCKRLQGGCEAGSPQEQWLRAELASHPGKCTLAIWHHPRFSSGEHGDNQDIDAFWRALVEAGVELLLSGHDHHYERLAPLDAEGRPSPDGVMQFIVGTGGTSLHDTLGTRPHSEALSHDVTGVLKLTLWPDSADWEFLPIPGHDFTDRGTVHCR